MPDHIAIKLLTERSDLGWFKSIFDGRNLKGNQKGITLGAKVFRNFYPSISERESAYGLARERAILARQMHDQDVLEEFKRGARAAGNLSVFATIYGPNGKEPFTRERIIARQDKNWRLNGRFILAPQDDQQRFNVLQDGDIAVIAFDGIDEPTAVSVLLLSADSELDRPLHEELRETQGLSKGSGSMMAMPAASLVAIADRLNLAGDHPLRVLAADTATNQDIEEAARGSTTAAERVKHRREGRGLTPEELAAGKAAAERNGALGEALVNKWLVDQAVEGVPQHRWVSSRVANAPYDFALLGEDGDLKAVLDVKTTSSRFSAEFFVSHAELEYAAQSDVPYEIWRVYEVGAGGAWLLPSYDFRPLANQLLQAAAEFPHGTRPSVVAIAPQLHVLPQHGHALLQWGQRVRLPPIVPLAPNEADLDEY